MLCATWSALSRSPLSAIATRWTSATTRTPCWSGTGDVGEFSKFMAECKARGGRRRRRRTGPAECRLHSACCEEFRRTRPPFFATLRTHPPTASRTGNVPTTTTMITSAAVSSTRWRCSKTPCQRTLSTSYSPCTVTSNSSPCATCTSAPRARSGWTRCFEPLRGDDFTAGFVSSIVESSMRSRTDKVTAPPDIIRTLGLATHVRDHSEVDPNRTLDLFGAHVRTVSAPESRDMRAFVSSLKYYATPVYTPEALSVSFHGFARFMAAPVVNSKPRPRGIGSSFGRHGERRDSRPGAPICSRRRAFGVCCPLDTRGA